jgi:hypothetical protein
MIHNKYLDTIRRTKGLECKLKRLKSRQFEVQRKCDLVNEELEESIQMA